MTDAKGRFSFDRVPAGKYELVARVPNWQIAGHDRDPETGAVSRSRYAAAVELRTPVIISRGGASTAVVAYQLTQFLAR